MSLHRRNPHLQRILVEGSGHRHRDERIQQRSRRSRNGSSSSGCLQSSPHS
jgi:hypothetical protein